MKIYIKSFVKKILHRDNEYISGYKKSEFAHIGKHCRIGPNCVLVPRNMYLDDFVIIQGYNNFISYNGKIVVKKYSVISSSCIIVPSNHKISIGIPFYLHAISHVGDDDHTIVIEEDVWIGAGCKLLPKSAFRRGCIIGAGSVVTKDIPPYAVAIGCPAKVVGVKFSIEDIMKHERLIYPPSERLTMGELEELFEKYYRGMKPLQSYVCSIPEKERLNAISNQISLDIQL